MSYPAQDIRRKDPPPPLSGPELRERFDRAFPEALGPATEGTGDGLYDTPAYGVPAERYVRIGRIPYPSGFGPAERDAERARLEAEAAAVPEAVRQARELIEAELAAERRRW